MLLYAGADAISFSQQGTRHSKGRGSPSSCCFQSSQLPTLGSQYDRVYGGRSSSLWVASASSLDGSGGSGPHLTSRVWMDFSCRRSGESGTPLTLSFPFRVDPNPSCLPMPPRTSLTAFSRSLILAPCFFSCMVYGCLGMLIRALGPEYSRLRPNWYLWVFCTADLIAIVCPLFRTAICFSVNSH